MEDEQLQSPYADYTVIIRMGTLNDSELLASTILKIWAIKPSPQHLLFGTLAISAVMAQKRLRHGVQHILLEHFKRDIAA